MKVLYLDLSMGVAGDMLSAALADLFDNKEQVIDRLNALNITGVHYSLTESVKRGIVGKKMTVTVNGQSEGEHDNHHDHDDHHHHHHSGLKDIERIISSLNISDNVKQNALNVYKLIAQAESRAHGVKVEEVHFHEVGAMDAVADVVAVSYLLDLLKVDEIVCSPIRTGFGFTRCMHGVIPVPAPATAYLLEGLTAYAGDEEGELATPTGVALVKNFVSHICAMPTMTIKKVGYGMGEKDFSHPNMVRAFFGETQENLTDEVVKLEFNVDDMTAEQLAYSGERLMRTGAKEVYLTPVTMKKSRLGTLVTVLCDQSAEDETVRAIFKNYSTIGLRTSVCKRYVLDRINSVVETPYGSVRKKVSTGYGLEKSKYEYDDVCRVAKNLDVSFERALSFIAEFDK
ncbi:MAG: nickel pincer cofactor biosynthesis protein LarC [Clostridia bacterium]|nr:nickel pincer cofactor biosynthesis protein LarC [Clostridia bacterium]